MDKLNHTIPQAVERSGIPRATFYKYVSSGDIKIVKVGRRTLVPETSLQDFQKKLLNHGLAK